MKYDDLLELFVKNTHEDKQIEIRNYLDSMDFYSKEAQEILVFIINNFDCDLYVYDKLKLFFYDLDLCDKLEILAILDSRKKTEHLLEEFVPEEEKILKGRIQSNLRGIELLEVEHKNRLSNIFSDTFFSSFIEDNELKEIERNMVINAYNIIHLINDMEEIQQEYYNDEYTKAVFTIGKYANQTKYKIETLINFFCFYDYNKEACILYLESVLEDVGPYVYNQKVIDFCERSVNYLMDHIEDNGEKLKVCILISKMIVNRLCLNFIELHKLSVSFVELLYEHLDFECLTSKGKESIRQALEIIKDNSIVGDRLKDKIRDVLNVLN